MVDFLFLQDEGYFVVEFAEGIFVVFNLSRWFQVTPRSSCTRGPRRMTPGRISGYFPLARRPTLPLVSTALNEFPQFDAYINLACCCLYFSFFGGGADYCIEIVKDAKILFGSFMMKNSLPFTVKIRLPIHTKWSYIYIDWRLFFLQGYFHLYIEV